MGTVKEKEKGIKGHVHLQRGASSIRKHGLQITWQTEPLNGISCYIKVPRHVS